MKPIIRLLLLLVPAMFLLAACGPQVTLQDIYSPTVFAQEDHDFSITVDYVSDIPSVITTRATTNSSISTGKVIIYTTSLLVRDGKSYFATEEFSPDSTFPYHEYQMQSGYPVLYVVYASNSVQEPPVWEVKIAAQKTMQMLCVATAAKLGAQPLCYQPLP